jgi:hypothetical protein
MKPKDTLDKVYGSIPREVNLHFDFEIVRGFKYYWYKLLRKITR